jgi:hypothetical protein
LYLRNIQFVDFQKAVSKNVKDIKPPARLQRLVPSDRVQAGAYTGSLLSST